MRTCGHSRRSHWHLFDKFKSIRLVRNNLSTDQRVQRAPGLTATILADTRVSFSGIGNGQGFDGSLRSEQALPSGNIIVFSFIVLPQE
mmetsp:Transcript_6170/g.26070  ORF Transcript_6170/g.26070 Transcript_6170/m.26070 type:complete len:88 (+) Transcript_6170:1401-1664(+)